MIFKEEFKLLRVLLVLIFISFSMALQRQHLEVTDFLKKIFKSEELTRCSTQLFVYEENKSRTPSAWFDSVEFLTHALHKLVETSGILVSDIESGSRVEDRRYQQPGRSNHAKRCSLVLLVVDSNDFPSKTEEKIKKALTMPLLYPSTLRNRDRYLIITVQHSVFGLQKSKLLKSLKYKLVLVLKEYEKGCAINCIPVELQVYVKHLCQYGLCKQRVPALIDVNLQVLYDLKYSNSVIPTLFPDHERNFFGYVLRLSTTTKVPQLLELKVLKDENGKKVFEPKRGLYASVLAELSKRLNFTYEIVPSSGNGSTGHALPNGTWIGTVGDTYKGIVDFGFMAAVTYQRFPYAEFCAPINFAYLGFVTGPPRKSYAWNAILWPFNPVMWMGVGLSILVSAKLMSIISQSSAMLSHESLAALVEKNVKWTYLKGVSFLVRGILGQCQELPKNMTHFSFRGFLTVWLFFCLIISAGYGSKMVSLLTFPVYEIIPTSFAELAVTKDFAIDFHYFGNVGYAYFKTSTNPSFTTIFKRMGREPSPLKCLQRTLNEKAACIIFILTFEELLHRNLSDQYGESTLKFTPDSSRVFPAGVIHEYKAPLSSNFQSVLYPAMETGLIPFWQQTDLNSVLENKNRWQKANNIDMHAAIWGADVNDNLLRVRNLKGAFIIFFLGLIAALFAFAVERYKKRHIQFT